ncbi:hypothetical protein LEAN103870_17150 [Legionella anisa]
MFSRKEYSNESIITLEKLKKTLNSWDPAQVFHFKLDDYCTLPCPSGKAV